MRKILLLIAIIACLFLSCSSQVETIKVELKQPQSQNSITSSEVFLQKASSFYNQELFDSAYFYCQKSYKKDSQNWELFYLFGKTAIKMERYEIAENNLFQALSLCTNDNVLRAKIYYALGEVEELRRNSHVAKQHYLMVIQLDNTSSLAKSAYKKINSQ